jgi:phosphate transport system substrate-binding protein
MKTTIIGALFFYCLGVGFLQAQDKIVIGGSGGLAEEMQELAKIYLQKHPSDAVDVIQESMSTTGGIEGAKAGRFTLGMVSRPPTDSEKGKLLYKRIVMAPVGVGVNKSMSVSNLSEAQVCDIFSGKIKTWKEVGGGEGGITVLGRKKDDNSMQVLYDKMACFKGLKLNPNAVLLVRASEVMDALEHRASTIAVVNVSSVMGERQNIKILAMDGASPTNESVTGGKYKYFTELGVVTLGEPHGAAKRFLEFVAGPDGDKVLTKYRWIPAR